MDYKQFKTEADYHLHWLPKVIDQVLQKHKVSGIAVPLGPGNKSLLTLALKLTKELCKERDVPLIPVSGTEAQIFSIQPRSFPFLSLVSTRHETMTVLTKGIGDHIILGLKIDNLAHEAIQ